MAKRKYYRKIYKKNKKNKIALILKLFILGFFVIVLGFFSVFFYYAKDFPRPEKFTERPYVQSTKIYDRTGETLLYEMYGEEKREIVPLNQISDYLKEAVISTEDASFYNHHGLDFKGLMRAISINLKLKKRAQGASTITQQLIRSSFLTTEKSAERKIREIILTLELERKYSKNQILEWYLNQIPFGSNTYGAEAASKTYFKKSAKDLTLAQSAVLASLIQAPSRLSPYGNRKEDLLKRKNYVLDRMAQENYITKNEAEKAKEEKLEFSEVIRPIKAPHFAIYVKNKLLGKYGERFLQRNGLKVYTSLDWDLQKAAEKAVEENAKINKNYRAYNASLVAINPKTGEILSMVGSKNWFAEPEPKGCDPGFNCLFEPKVNIAAYRIGRQPGSAFKPFAYAAAFKKGYTSDTALWDVKTNFGTWGAEPYIPQNYDKKFRGVVNLRNALSQSINIPAVKVLYLAGIKETINIAKRLGITTLNQSPSFYGLSLVLGGGEVKLLDITSAYGVFAADGLKVSPTAILKIEDSKGNIIEKNEKTPKRVIEIQTARLVSDILSDNNARAPMFGYNSSLYFKNYQVAAKTGTTQNYKDAWVIGYSPSIAVGVWAGNNDSSPTNNKPGIVLAAPIWRQFMENALLKFPKENFKKPDPISTKKPVLNGQIGNYSILYYVDKNNPQGPEPQNPEGDSQYSNWEKGIKEWLESNQN